MGDQTFDVAVVGAGPAGAVAARALAAAGRRVVVLDKAHFPRYKTCGGGILRRAAGHSGLDLGAIAERVHTRVDLNLLDAGLRFSTVRPEPVVWMTMRSTFDAALLEAARGAGAEVRTGAAVEEVGRAADGVTLRTRGGEVRARYVIGADGVSSVVAKAGGWPRLSHVLPALEWELAVDGDTFQRFADAPRFDFDLPAHGYAWVFPKGGHLSVGVLSTSRRENALHTYLAEYLQRLNIKPERTERHGYGIPVRPRRGGFMHGRLLLAGDAAGLADPVTAEGISHAMLSGKLAAEAVVAGGDDPRAVKRHYENGLRKEILKELQTARVLAWFLYGRPGLRTWLFRRHGQKLAELMTDLTAGGRGYRALARDPRNLVRLLLPGKK